ncbi:hypothetical protein C8R43DRAFT_977624 [Mycena crocata]|nr:hypothetical protein C8R43DRAFT_977624 [Mycena crocata]
MAPVLPDDLERDIFELAASMYPRMIPAFLRVAHRVLRWLEPLLYRVLRISTEGKRHKAIAAAVLRAAQARQDNFLGDAVRHLFLDSPAPWSLEEAQDILKHCTGLVNFAAHAEFCSPTLLPILGGIHLKRLSCSLVYLFGGRDLVNLHHPAFSSLTHLDIEDNVRDALKIYTHLPALPVLTHLSLNNSVSWDVVNMLLMRCRRLEVLVNLFPFFRADRAYAAATNPPLNDVRFVVAVYIDNRAEWAAGARGEIDFWALAEMFVAKKRSGEIAASCYWLEDMDVDVPAAEVSDDSDGGPIVLM